MHVHCNFHRDYLTVYKGKRSIGLVRELNGDVQIELFDSVTLSFNDIAIIQDNWVQFKEMQLTKES
jgi:hypothetical protein